MQKSNLVSLTAALVATFVPAVPAFAQAPPTFTPEGRPVAGIQVGTPTPDAQTGVTFERNRIKRTPQMLPKTALSESRWDLLYAVTEPNGAKIAYFDWDSDNIYLAWESPTPEAVRFDLDGSDDGFLRGADNLRVQVEMPVSLDPDAFSTTVPVTCELWDAAQSGDRPLRTPAPLPQTAIQAVAGRTDRGTYVVMVAISKTELVGLSRTAGRKIGLRIESGGPLATPDGTTLLSNRPLLHLQLSDRVPAQEGNVRVGLQVLSGKELIPGDGLRAVLEATNLGKNPVVLTRLFVRGSQASLPFVDSGAFTGLTLAPGQTTKRELKSVVAAQTPVGAHVLSGGAEWTTDVSGTATPVTIAALASFNRVDPYYIQLSQPKTPVLTSSERGVGGTQTVTVTLGSRIADVTRTNVLLSLPLGWSLDGGDGVDRIVVLQGRGDYRTLRFKIQVPAQTPPGQYVIETRATIEGNPYTAAATVTVATAPAPKPK